MKLSTLIKLESPIVSTALFIAGIVISTGALFEYYNDSAKITIPQIALTMSLTFLAGLISIHITARSIKQTVVYLERKRTEEQHKQSASDAQGQLALDPITKFLETGTNRSRLLINELARQLEAGQVALYVAHENNLEVTEGYGLTSDSAMKYACQFGEGLIGRVASAGQSLCIDDLPERYITVHSGLGSASPRFLVIIPLMQGQETKGVLELALFKAVTHETIKQLETIGKAWADAGL